MRKKRQVKGGSQEISFEAKVIVEMDDRKSEVNGKEMLTAGNILINMRRF